MSANYLKIMVLTISMSPGIKKWCMIILMSKCSTCQYVGFAHAIVQFIFYFGPLRSAIIF